METRDYFVQIWRPAVNNRLNRNLLQSDAGWPMAIILKLELKWFLLTLLFFILFYISFWLLIWLFIWLFLGCLLFLVFDFLLQCYFLLFTEDFLNFFGLILNYL